MKSALTYMAIGGLIFSSVPSESIAQSAPRSTAKAKTTRAPPRPPITYANFVLTPEDLAAMSTEEEKACFIAAPRAYNPIGQQMTCNQNQADRLNPLVIKVVDAASPPSRTPANTRYWNDHYGWVGGRVEMCRVKHTALGEGTTTYTLSFMPCFNQETYRRIKWVQRPR